VGKGIAKKDAYAGEPKLHLDNLPYKVQLATAGSNLFPPVKLIP
jgi:hypothetical protein